MHAIHITNEFLKFNGLTFNFWDLVFWKIIMMKQISQPSLTASWFQNFLLLLVKKVNIAIYSQSIPFTYVFTHAFWLTNFVQNVSIRLKIKVMSGKSVFFLTKGNLEVHLDKNHYDIHATCIAQLPNITLQKRLSGDMIDSTIMQTRMSVYIWYCRSIWIIVYWLTYAMNSLIWLAERQSVHRRTDWRMDRQRTNTVNNALTQ